jgi:hypothetical protein
MAEEWRLTAELDGDPAEIERFARELAGRLPAGARLTRDGRTVRVYSDTEPEAARIEARALQLLDRGSAGYELWHDRWDEEGGEWEEIAPDLPAGEEVTPEEPDVEEPAPEEPAPPPEAGTAAAPASGFPGAVTSLRDAGALVLVSLSDRDSAAELRSRLAAAGIPVVSRRRGVGIPAAGENAAADLATHLEEQLPPGTKIETRRLPGRGRE